MFQDDHLENSRKVPLDRHDIIIDKVAASHDNNYVVAVTSNNMVRIFFSLWDHPDITSAKGLGGLVSGSKGQLIFIRLFLCLQFSQKTNLKTQIFALSYRGRIFSFVFWEN